MTTTTIIGSSTKGNGLLIDRIMEPKKKKVDKLVKENENYRQLVDKHMQKLRSTGYKYYNQELSEEDIMPGDVLDLSNIIGKSIEVLPYTDKKENYLYRIFRSQDNNTTFCIDSYGRLFGYGKNQYGQLGCGHLDHLHFFGDMSTLSQLNDIQGWDHIISKDDYTMGRVYNKDSRTFTWYHWGTFMDKTTRQVEIVKKPKPMTSEYMIPSNILNTNSYAKFRPSLSVSDEVLHVYLGVVEIPDESGQVRRYHNIGEIDLYFHVNKNPGGKLTRIRELLVSSEEFVHIKKLPLDYLMPLEYRKKPNMEQLLLTHLFINTYHQLTLEEVIDMRYASNPQIKDRFNQLLQKFD